MSYDLESDFKGLDLPRREGKDAELAAIARELEARGRKVLVLGDPPPDVLVDDASFRKLQDEIDVQTAAAADELDRRLKEIRETGRKVGVRETLLLAELSAKAGKPLDARVEFTAEAARFKRLCSPARRGKVAR